LVFEMDEIVVSNTHMSQDDFFELYRFKLWAQLAYGAAYLKEIIMHCLNHEITPLEIYDHLMNDKTGYPFINEVLTEYTKRIKPLFFESPQALEEALSRHIEEQGDVESFYYIRHLNHTMARVLGSETKGLFVNEVVKAAKGIYKSRSSNDREKEDQGAFYDVIEELGQIQVQCIISPLERQQLVLEEQCSYDLEQWAKDNYENPLSDYRLPQSITIYLLVRNIEEHDAFFEETKDYDSDSWKYDYYYAVMVSSNMRRIISTDDGRNQGKSLLPGAVHPMKNDDSPLASYG